MMYFGIADLDLDLDLARAACAACRDACPREALGSYLAMFGYRMAPS
ncbi:MULTISPECIES: hypothetical protein [unclassified Caballeronia]|nr:MULTISPECIES: hypothetical protein [unclassified Caballeronia]